MASRAKFTSRRGGFNSKNNAFINLVVGHMAQDVEVGIKVTAGTPIKHGAMKGAVKHRMIKRGSYRVESPLEYSAVQELGRRSGARAFTNYTTPGTSKGWFRRAVNSVVAKRNMYVAEARRATGL